MSFAEQLAQEAHGIRFTPAPSFEPQPGSDSGESALLVDRRRGVGLQLGFSRYRLDLSPAHEAQLGRDIERAARELFLQQRALLKLPSPGGRTEDPAWSPVVSVTRREVSGAPALEVVHRLSYQPGHELVMGHLLVPVRGGLFELRPFARAATTGMKESLLFVQTRAASPDETMRLMTQAFIDDPSRDALFPDHPLTLVRAVLRELREDPGLAVTAPAAPSAGGELVLSRLGCAFTPPPRYLLHEESDRFAQLARVSLAGTDGLALLSVTALGGSPGDAGALAALGTRLGRQAVPAGSSEVVVEDRTASGPRGRRDASVHVTFTRGDFIRGRTLMRLFTDERQQAWALIIGTGQSAPEEELAAELDEMTRSFRRP